MSGCECESARVFIDMLFGPPLSVLWHPISCLHAFDKYLEFRFKLFYLCSFTDSSQGAYGSLFNEK